MNTEEILHKTELRYRENMERDREQIAQAVSRILSQERERYFAETVRVKTALDEQHKVILTEMKSLRTEAREAEKVKGENRRIRERLVKLEKTISAVTDASVMAQLKARIRSLEAQKADDDERIAELEARLSQVTTPKALPAPKPEEQPIKLKEAAHG